MTTMALVGNPNCGKTTIFNKLTGSSQRVGNWPGVTIEKKVGKLRGKKDVDMVDLPGVYSLSPYSPEEIITRNYLVHESPDVIIDIVDASNLERNLYLTTQVMEMGIPVVIALNMMDIAESRGILIDIKELSKRLGCMIIPTYALKNDGLDEVSDAAVAEVGHVPEYLRFSDETEKCISKISELIDSRNHATSRWYAIKLLERDELAQSEYEDILDEINPLIETLEKSKDDTGDSIVAEERYNAIGLIVSGVREETKNNKETISDKIDKIVTNKWLGLPIFAGIMFITYYIAMTTVGAYFSGWVNDVFFGEWVLPGVQSWLENMNVDPVLIGLIVDGMLAGVGAVLGFLPQVLILFILLTILEDCGYMARICFVMDRVFRKFNLSGKSFIPLLVGTGCGIPGIMASRTIENDTDRKLTAMTTTFMPCSAKLPIIALIAGALFGGSALVALFCYFLGIGCVLISGIILKKLRTFAGAPSIFIMELPPYHAPKFMNVVKTTFDRGWAFVKKAGTFIMLACAIVWFLSAFSWNLTMVDDINESMLASIGQAVCWVFTPLGWGGDWQFSVATITGLLAKENVVGTFGVLFGFDEVSEAGEEIWTVIAAMLGTVGGLSFLAFNMICAPCFAAIGAMRRELGTWKMTMLAVAYQCGLAYIIAMMIYQFGSTIIYGTFSLWLIPTIVIAILMIYLLIAKDPFRCLNDKPEEVTMC
jgi:ferrous iron transport protein B